VVRGAAHRLIVLPAVALAVAVAGGCGGGSSPDTAARPTLATTTSSGALAAPPATGLTPNALKACSRRSVLFLHALRRACPPARSRVTASASRRERAARFRREAERLAALAKRLARVQPPTNATKPLSGYRDALGAEISLDRRIARAIDRGDHDSEAVGTRQNEYNRSSRSHLAVRLGVSCLRDIEPE
jgi:hypothetical protein